MQVSIRNLVFVVLLISAALCAADDPLMGTWKLNVAKSSFNPGPPPMSSIVRYEPFGKDGFKCISETVNAKGETMHSTYAAEYDGKGYPMIGSSTHDTNLVTRSDPYTHQITNKKNGRITATAQRVISKDGKSMAITVTETNPQGENNRRVLVYDKQ